MLRKYAILLAPDADPNAAGGGTTTDDKPKTLVVDPLVQSILSSMDKVLPPEPEALPPAAVVPKMTLGEMVVDKQELRKKTEGATDGETAEQKTAREAEEKVKADKVKAEADAAAAAAAVAARPKVVRKPAVVPPAPLVPVTPTAEDTKRKEDETYIAGLTPEQQEEIAVAQFAEGHGKPGVTAQTIEYFRKVDGFIAANPDSDPEALDAFIKSNKPKWGEAERRKVERQMIMAEAKAEALKEVEPAIRENARELRAIHLTPMIEGSVTSATAAMTGEDGRWAAVEGKPTLTPVERAVVDAVQSKGLEAASKEFPIEAPIVNGTINATRAWLQISNGLVPFNPEDQTHAWLIDFVSREGANMKRQSKEAQTLEDGRTFLPLHEFRAALKQDQAGTEARHYTFTDKMIVDLLADNAVIAINARIKSLESAGFKREVKKVSGETRSPEAKAADKVTDKVGETGASPRAGGSRIPGATDTAPATNPNSAFFERLSPGLSKLVSPG